MIDLKRHLLTPEQEDLKNLIKDFGEKEIIPACKIADETGEFPIELVKKATGLGLTLLALPEKYGGLGCSFKTIAVAKEEMGHADIGFNTTMGACILASLPVKVAGNDYHWGKVADVLTGGGLTSFALTEPGAGSDAGSIKTKAEKKGDSYVLNGTKCFITNAQYADLFTVIAVTDPEKGVKGGMTAFLVDKDTEGLVVGKEENKMGCRSSNTCDVAFIDCVVPEKNVLGNVGEGFQIAMKTLGLARSSSGAAAVGNARYCIEYINDYAKDRVLFGKPINKLQAIQHMIADSYMKMEAARGFVYYACEIADNGIIDAAISSASKAFATDCGMQIVTDAIQVMGGYGYSKEYPIEKRFRDAKITQIWEGTNQVQRNIIAGDITHRER